MSLDHRRSLRALVLRSRKVNEADRLLDLLGEEGELFRAKAKWAARSRKRFAGGLEPLGYGSFALSRRQLQWGWMIEQVQVLESFAGIRGNLGAYYLACYFCELLLHAMQPEEPQPEVFEIMNFALHWLERGGEDLARVKVFFELRLLAALGSLAPFSGCALCGSDDALVWRFRVREGTWNCASHGQGAGGRYHDLHPRDRQLVDDLAFGDPEALLRSSWSPEQRRCGLELASSCMEQQVGGSMRSLSFVKPFLEAVPHGEDLPALGGKNSQG